MHANAGLVAKPQDTAGVLLASARRALKEALNIMSRLESDPEEANAALEDAASCMRDCVPLLSMPHGEAKGRLLDAARGLRTELDAARGRLAYTISFYDGLLELLGTRHSGYRPGGSPGCPITSPRISVEG